jgi:predicted flap endonuclease-1-like 5' DNA nuclease
MRPQPPAPRPSGLPLRGSGLPPPAGISSPPSAGAPQTIPSGGAALSAETRALHLANQLVQARQDLASAQADLRNARSERDSLRAELARTRSRVEELEALVAGKQTLEPPAFDPDLEQRLRGRINELEAALANARSSSATPAASDGGDLQAVKGIGPKIEKQLKAHGITDVRQIAEWTAEDIEAVAKKIGVKAARIRKDDWVGGAKRIVGSL